MNLTRKAHRLLLSGIAPLMMTLLLPVTAHAAPPAAAIQAGMEVNTFSSNFTAKTVDINDTHNRGYKWYLADFFGVEARATAAKLNSDGSVTLTGDRPGAVGTLTSVNPLRGTNAFVGTAFGGGAYIEGVFAYDPAQVTRTHTGKRYPYPSFWSLPMEGTVIQGANQWPGQPAGYVHQVEVDFFEADVIKNPRQYGVGMHDWWGIKGVTCPKYCLISPHPVGIKEPPAGTDFRQFHTYGFLWVPATATQPGYVESFFDGQPHGYKVSWAQYTNQPPTPAGKPWAFGKTDQQHLFFILGTGVGETYTVKSVNVWQRNGSRNLTN